MNNWGQLFYYLALCEGLLTPHREAISCMNNWGQLFYYEKRLDPGTSRIQPL